MALFKFSFFRAKPQTLFFQMLIDWLWWYVFQPQGAWAVLIFIAFLPGMDLISAVGSFWNYVKANR